MLKSKWSCLASHLRGADTFCLHACSSGWSQVKNQRDDTVTQMRDVAKADESNGGEVRRCPEDLPFPIEIEMQKEARALAGKAKCLENTRHFQV